MVEEEFRKQDFIKQLLLTLNYFILILLLIEYKNNGQSIAYWTLLVAFSLERFYRIINSMMLFSFVGGFNGVLKGILLSIVCFDYSIGIDIFYDELSFDEDLFFGNLNYISHLINYIPLSFNFGIMFDKTLFDIVVHSRKQETFLLKSIVKQLNYYYPRTIIINSEEPKVFISLSCTIISYVAFYKYIKQFVPVNHCAAIYDLYD
ncbi:hypothetical protein ABPG73_004290 [Tetrahymena malaccensis]